MTTVLVSVDEKDDREYNLMMSVLHEALAPVAEHFNGKASIGPLKAENKPSMMVQFNNAADADAFIQELEEGKKHIPVLQYKKGLFWDQA